MYRAKRAIGVDYGARRVGIACAAEGIAFAAEVVPSAEALERVARVAAERSAETVVVGLPLHMDGAESEMAHGARSFAGRLAKALPEAEIVLWDERLSSAEAAWALREAGRAGEPDDATAAAIVLQNYLDSLKNACI